MQPARNQAVAVRRPRASSSPRRSGLRSSAWRWSRKEVRVWARSWSGGGSSTRTMTGSPGQGERATFAKTLHLGGRAFCNSSDGYSRKFLEDDGKCSERAASPFSFLLRLVVVVSIHRWATVEGHLVAKHHRPEALPGRRGLYQSARWAVRSGCPGGVSRRPH